MKGYLAQPLQPRRKADMPPCRSLLWRADLPFGRTSRPLMRHCRGPPIGLGVRHWQAVKELRNRRESRWLRRGGSSFSWRTSNAGERMRGCRSLWVVVGAEGELLFAAAGAGEVVPDGAEDDSDGAVDGMADGVAAGAASFELRPDGTGAGTRAGSGRVASGGAVSLALGTG